MTKDELFRHAVTIHVAELGNRNVANSSLRNTAQSTVNAYNDMSMIEYMRAPKYQSGLRWVRSRLARMFAWTNRGHKEYDPS